MYIMLYISNLSCNQNIIFGINYITFRKKSQVFYREKYDKDKICRKHNNTNKPFVLRIPKGLLCYTLLISVFINYEIACS